MSRDVPTPLILFDGPCSLCRRSVRWILRHERDSELHFASLQSDTGRAVLRDHGLPEEIDAMVLIENGRAREGSDAAFEICRHLKAPWRLLRALRWTPPAVHRRIYRWIARNRTRWFGRVDACDLPDPEREERFLDL